MFQNHGFWLSFFKKTCCIFLQLALPVCFRSSRNIAQSLSLFKIVQKETSYKETVKREYKNLASFYDVLGLKIYVGNLVVMVL